MDSIGFGLGTGREGPSREDCLGSEIRNDGILVLILLEKICFSFLYCQSGFDMKRPVPRFEELLFHGLCLFLVEIVCFTDGPDEADSKRIPERFQESDRILF